MKSVQIRSYFCSVFRPNTGNYEPEITPYLDTFHVVNFFCVYMRSTKRNVSDMTKLVYKKGGFWEAAQRPCHGAGGGGGRGWEDCGKPPWENTQKQMKFIYIEGKRIKTLNISIKFFSFIGIHSIQGWSLTIRQGVKRKKRKRWKTYRKVD